MSSSSSSSNAGPTSSSSSSTSDDSFAALYGIRLDIFSQVLFTPGQHSGFRFRIEAVHARNMTDKVFRYVRSTEPDTLEEIDEFDGVCSPIDLDEIAEDNPSSGSIFSRKNFVDVIVRSKSIGEEAITAIQEQVTTLLESMENIRFLEGTDSESSN